MEVLAPGGFLFGHDYHTPWAGVKHDVHLFVSSPEARTTLAAISAEDLSADGRRRARLRARCSPREVANTGSRLWTSGNLWVVRKGFRAAEKI